MYFALKPPRMSFFAPEAGENLDLGSRIFGGSELILCGRKEAEEKARKEAEAARATAMLSEDLRQNSEG